MAVIGERLKGRYLIIDRLGEGGQSKVYLAEDQYTGKTLVVKEMIVSEDPEENRERLILFEREYIFLKHLKHPLLIKLYDFFSEGGSYYLAEDYVEGKTLETQLRHNSLIEKEKAVKVVLDLAEALAYLHKNNIIYRDIKPSNIIIDNENRARLVDFTISRIFKEEKSADTICIGTPGYSPPEQYGRYQTDARSDIYSLGALLHQLLTGCDPARNPFKFPFEEPLPYFQQFIEMATALNPNDRFQTMRQFKNELEHVYKRSLYPETEAKTDIVFLTDNDDKVTKKRTFPFKPVGIVVVIVIIIIIIVIMFFVFKR